MTRSIEAPAAGGPNGPSTVHVDRDVCGWADAFTTAEAARIVVMIGNYRCGTTLFKTSAAQFGDIAPSHEVFSRDARGAGPQGFDVFLGSVADSAHAALADPVLALKAYVAWYLDQTAPHRVIIDMKYTDLGRLGLTLDAAPVPQILEILSGWRLPVIHIQRAAVLREAISFLVARRTGRFQRFARDADDPVQGALSIHLDPEEVITTARRCREAHLLAAELLNRLGLRHYRVFYEDFRGPARLQVVMQALHAAGIWCEPPASLKDHVLEQRSAEQVSNLFEILDHARRVAPDLVVP